MKNKKIIFIGSILFIILLVFVLYLINNKEGSSKIQDDNKLDSKTDTEPANLLEAVLKKNGKTKTEASYSTFVGGEVLTEGTFFIDYAFIVNNKAYIYDPEKLKTDELSYKKVYDIPDNINVTNIGIPFGADIYFYDDIGNQYILKDTNIDNDIKSGYLKYEKANYELKNYTTELYKITDNIKENYDIRCNLFYAKDNILYKINYGYYNFIEKRDVPDSVEKVSGNYENQKILHIYNDRIVKTDKGFYELIEYSDNGNVYTTTMKIDLLTKYYDDVLTFTYDYVILKDYTLIPINDVMTNRSQKYLNGFYLGRLDEKPVEFVE